MKTHPVSTSDGNRFVAFEVENAYINPATIARLLADLDGVTEVTPRRMFSMSSDVHVEFKYQGKHYIVWEAFGDNSRYWIGPKEERNDIGEITLLEAAFKRYIPPFCRTLFGDIVTLNLLLGFLKDGGNITKTHYPMKNAAQR